MDGPAQKHGSRPLLRLLLSAAQLAAIVVTGGLLADTGLGKETLGMAIVTFALLAAGASLRSRPRR